MSDVFEKCTPNIQLMVMLFKSRYRSSDKVAEKIGVCKSTLDKIRDADNPATIRIKRDTRQAIERRFREVFSDTGLTSKVRLSAHVMFPLMIKLLNDKGIATLRIADDIGISSNTIRNYKNGSDPKYENGALLIEYAAKHLSKSELYSVGVICD